MAFCEVPGPYQPIAAACIEGAEYEPSHRSNPETGLPAVVGEATGKHEHDADQGEKEITRV